MKTRRSVWNVERMSLAWNEATQILDTSETKHILFCLEIAKYFVAHKENSLTEPSYNFWILPWALFSLISTHLKQQSFDNDEYIWNYFLYHSLKLWLYTVCTYEAKQYKFTGACILIPLYYPFIWLSKDYCLQSLYIIYTDCGK